MNLNQLPFSKTTEQLHQSKPALKNLVNNHNYLQCKFQTNKFQENLLTKRLKQLDADEMKTRLKNQRDSNDLIGFLRNCQLSTGYLDNKLKAHRQGNISKIIQLNQSSSKSKNDVQYIGCQTELIRLNQLSRPRQTSTAISRKSQHFLDQLSASSSNSSTPNSNATFQNYSSSTGSTKSSKAPSTSSRNTFSTDSFADLKTNLQGLEPIKNASKSSYSNQKTQKPKFSSPLNLSDDYSSENLANINWFTSTVDFDSDSESHKSQKNEPVILGLEAIQQPVKSESLTKFSSLTSGSQVDSRRSSLLSSSKADSRRSSLKSNSQQPGFESKSLNKLLNSQDFNSLLKSHRNNESSLLSGRRMSAQSKLLLRKDSASHQKQTFPIQVAMSKSLLRKKQSEIVNEYQVSNSIELHKNLRQTQENINDKVKQFSNKTIRQIL